MESTRAAERELKTRESFLARMAGLSRVDNSLFVERYYYRMSMLRKTTEFLSLYHVSFLIFHWNYKQNECPEPEPGCDFEAVEEAKELWKTLKVTPQAPQVFTIQMEQIAPFGKKMSTLLCIFFSQFTEAETEFSCRNS